MPKGFDWPKLQSAWSQCKARGNTALAVTKVATQYCQARSSSDAPNEPETCLYTASTKRVIFALGPKEDPNSNTETGQDKYPEGHKANDPNSNAEREEKQLEGREEDPKPVTAQHWPSGLKSMEKVRRSNPRSARRIPSQGPLSQGKPSTGFPA